jgi:hypothetical protein
MFMCINICPIAFLVDNIEEFMPPNFHVSVYRYFELFIPLVIAGAVLGLRHCPAC